MTTETSTTGTTDTTDIQPQEPSNPCKREITVAIPADVVSTQADAVLLRYQKQARVPGFRKGKVPASIVRQRFADEIKSDIVEALVPRYFREETQKQNLQPVSQPRVTDLHLHQGEPLTFKATFEVLPEFKIAAYDDIHVEKVPTEVNEEEVERALDNLRQRQATYSPVEEERPLADGDFA
ncbi:MAG TPA: trigger factor, partial [Terriglobales bacterium]|nr:trigger factor [Terriglobales bacterium]